MTIAVDSYPVENEAEALTLMRHHLRLASSYFEATPDPIPTDFAKGDFAEEAFAAFVAAMAALYS